MKGVFAIGLMAFAALAQAQTKTDEFVPQWAKSAVWYQIFPDRFRNGDATNDPTAADIAGADPMDPPKQWRVHPWGSDWYQLQDYEKANPKSGSTCSAGAMAAICRASSMNWTTFRISASMPSI